MKSAVRGGSFVLVHESGINQPTQQLITVSYSLAKRDSGRGNIVSEMTAILRRYVKH